MTSLTARRLFLQHFLPHLASRKLLLLKLHAPSVPEWEECRDLIGIDISTKEGLEKARELGIFDTLCVKFVKDAVEIIETIL